MNWKLAPIVLIAFYTLSCTKKESLSDNSRNLINPLSSNQEIISYSGGSIQVRDVEDKMKPHIEKAREVLFNAYIMEAEKVFIERHQEKLISEAVVTDEEVKKYATANKIVDVPLEKVKEFLLTEKMRVQKHLAFENLKKEMGVKNRLGAALFEAKAGDHVPFKGDGNAKVKLQVFCDFANGMCNRIRLVLGQAEAQYGNKIQWFYRHFPVPSNPGSFESAKIAICSGKQNKFWNAHEALNNLEGNLKEKDLKEVVVIAGVNKNDLDNCLNSNEPETILQEDIKAASDIGIVDTPTVLINGQKVKDLDQIIPTIKTLL